MINNMVLSREIEWIDLPQFSGRFVKIVSPVFRTQRGSDSRALNEPVGDCKTFPHTQRSFFSLHLGF